MRFKEYKEGGNIDPNYYNRLSEIESNNNSQARSKTSSASGKFQFIKSTWEGLVKKHGLPYTLEDRFDPEKSKRVAELYTQENANYLKNKLGITPTNTDLYAAHFMGVGGASKLLSTLKQNPNASAYDVATTAQINANKPIFLRKDGTVKTAKEVYDTLNYKVTKTKGSVVAEQNSEVGQQNNPYTFREFKPTDYYAPQASQNVSSLDNTQEITNLAEDKSAEIKNKLDQKKAEKDFLEQMIKATEVAYVNPADFQSQPTFEDIQEDQMFQQGGNFKEFYKGYINSPNYKKRLITQGYNNPEQVKKDRLNNLNKITQSEVNDIGSQYYHPLNKVNIDNKELKKYSLNKEITTAHEYSHGVGAMNTGNSNFTKNLTLNNKETSLINSKNNYLDIDTSYNNKKLSEDQKADIRHNSLPSEAKADIDALRYKLKKDNIYNTGTQEFNQNHLNKAKKLYSNDKMIQRNFKAFGDKDLINLMNTIAEQSTSSEDYIQYAQQGGSIPVSSQGVYDFPNQEVLVPTDGAITMKNIPHDILGISQETGQQILMQPEQEYFFPNTKNVLEIPQTKRIKTKRFSK